MRQRDKEKQIGKWTVFEINSHQHWMTKPSTKKKSWRSGHRAQCKFRSLIFTQFWYSSCTTEIFFPIFQSVNFEMPMLAAVFRTPTKHSTAHSAVLSCFIRRKFCFCCSIFLVLLRFFFLVVCFGSSFFPYWPLFCAEGFFQEFHRIFINWIEQFALT